MILFQPIILASEFAQHAIMIVLFGVVLAEYISLFKRHQSLNVATEKSSLADGQAITPLMPPAETKNALLIKKKTMLLLLVAVFIASLWIIAEFFVDLDNFAYHVLFHWPIVVLVLMMLWKLARSLSGTLRFIFAAFAVVALVHIALDVSYFLYTPSWDRIVRSLLKTVEVLPLYFFVLQYLIHTDNEPR